MKSLPLLALTFFLATCAFAQTPAENLARMNITLPEPTPPVANYVKYVRSGNLIFLAGHGPCGGEFRRGKVSEDLTMEEAYQAARLTALCLVGTLHDALDGDLNKVKRIVRVFGMVNAPEGFTDQPEVINGASDFLVEVFGEKGKHARAAVGMASLPRNIPVEIEMIVEVTD